MREVVRHPVRGAADGGDPGGGESTQNRATSAWWRSTKLVSVVIVTSGLRCRWSFHQPQPACRPAPPPVVRRQQALAGTTARSRPARRTPGGVRRRSTPGGRLRPGWCLRCWHATCPGGVAALGELPGQGCHLRPGADRHPGRRQLRRGSPQVTLGHDPVQGNPHPASWARCAGSGRGGLPGAGLAPAVAGRGARHQHRRGVHLFAARLRQRGGHAGPGHRGIQHGHPGGGVAGGWAGPGHLDRAVGVHRRRQPVRQDHRGRLLPHPGPGHRRSAGRHRGG